VGTKIYLAGVYMNDVIEFNTETEEYKFLYYYKPENVMTLLAPAGDSLVVIPSG